MNGFTLFKRTSGYIEDTQGYAFPFSWWRYGLDYRFWHVYAHTGFAKSSLAVVDDFGDLVGVSS